MIKETSLPNHYSNLDDLTLYRWDKYARTKDNNWFLVDYDGREKKLICDDLKELEAKLIDDYFTLIDDRGFSLKIQKWAKIDSLRTKYHVVGLLLNRMKQGYADWQQENRFFIIKELKSWGFKYPELNTVEDDNILTSNYMTALQGISTQIGMLSNELKEDGEKEHKSLHRQIVFVESIIKISINEREISVAKWVAYLQEIQERAKQN